MMAASGVLTCYGLPKFGDGAMAAGQPDDGVDAVSLVEDSESPAMFEDTDHGQ